MYETATNGVTTSLKCLKLCKISSKHSGIKLEIMEERKWKILQMSGMVTCF